MEELYRSGSSTPGLLLKAVDIRRKASDTIGDPAPWADTSNLLQMPVRQMERKFIQHYQYHIRFVLTTSYFFMVK